MSRFVRENSLSLFFLLIFLATLVGQTFVGHASFNHEQLAHQDATISLGRYLNSSAFWVDVMENWQSEYLQFTLHPRNRLARPARIDPQSQPKSGKKAASPTKSRSSASTSFASLLTGLRREASEPSSIRTHWCW